MSWLHQDDGYHLLCNRDERGTRATAHGPETRISGGVRYVAPLDAAAGGTWIGTNEFGLSLCLLNGWMRAGQTGRQLTSRGLLLPELLSAESVDEVQSRVWRLDLARFAAFTLAVLEPGRPASIVEWDGSEKSIHPYAEPYMPLVSSSFDPGNVAVRRREEFRRCLVSAGRLDSSVLFSFHQSHAGQPGAHSPCMHRADAETVSFSWVKVTASEVEFYYAPGAPCRSRPGVTRRLALSQ